MQAALVSVFRFRMIATQAENIVVVSHITTNYLTTRQGGYRRYATTEIRVIAAVSGVPRSCVCVRERSNLRFCALRPISVLEDLHDLRHPVFHASIEQTFPR